MILVQNRQRLLNGNNVYFVIICAILGYGCGASKKIALPKKDVQVIKADPPRKDDIKDNEIITYPKTIVKKLEIDTILLEEVQIGKPISLSNFIKKQVHTTPIILFI